MAAIGGDLQHRQRIAGHDVVAPAGRIGAAAVQQYGAGALTQRGKALCGIAQVGQRDDVESGRHA